MSTQPRVMVLAGEASGDLHGARFVEALKHRVPGAQFNGMGSVRLQRAGVELLVDCANISVVGLVEVVRRWPEIKKALGTIESAIANNPPDLLVLIDYVEFNLRMAAVAKRVGIKVLFYISPQIWAWRPERVYKIGALVDVMAVIFPFEVALYEQAGIPVKYVGHPLAGHVRPACTRETLVQELNISKNNRLVGLLPGSRGDEIRRILPVLLDAAIEIERRHEAVSFLIPLAPNVQRQEVEIQINKRKLTSVFVLAGRAYDVMGCADSIAIASGTATLEAALIGAPMAIVYKVSALSWLWMRRKLLIKRVGLANIVAQKAVAPEFIQSRCRRDLIAEEILLQLNDVDYNKSMRNALGTVKSMLGEKDAANEVAELALKYLP